MSRRTLLLLATTAALAAPGVHADQVPPRTSAASAEFAGDARVPVAALASALGAWVAAEFDLPSAPPPTIRFSSSETMIALYRGGATPAGGASARRVAALYDRRLGVIHLPVGWTGANVVELSMLVHEMVHHLQTRAGWRPGCAAEAEALAYEAQGRWLALFGQDLTTALLIDPLYLKPLGVCGF